MSSPAVENCRKIPLIVDYGPMDTEIETGFPFDRDFNRNRFRSGLDDFTQRHPELAEHFDDFPFRSNLSEEPEFRSRFANRPFNSRFERFCPEYFNENPPQYQHFYQSRPEYYPPEHFQSAATNEEEAVPKRQENDAEKPQPSERSRKVQQSNTVDLGTKQEPVTDRSQRSMSAPPPENRTGQRFVSSINIPIRQPGGEGDMGSQHSQPPTATNKPTERVIPIHVEGRDEPIIPKNVNPTFSSTFGNAMPPQTERIFSQRPETFFQREPRQFGSPEWKHESVPPQQQKPSQKQNQMPPQPPQHPEPAPAQHEIPTQQEKSKSSTPIDQIKDIQKDVSNLMLQVEQFTGQPKDKQYRYLDEMLTRNLLKLDNIDTQGQENIRTARKEAVKCIEKCIEVLEAKANANVASSNNTNTARDEMQVEQSSLEENKDAAEEKMDVTTEEVTPAKEDAPSMEVASETNSKTAETTMEINTTEADKTESLEGKTAESQTNTVEEENEEKTSVIPEDEKKDKKKTKRKGEKK